MSSQLVSYGECFSKVVEVEQVVRRRTGMRDNGDPNFWVEAARQRDDGEKSANCW